MKVAGCEMRHHINFSQGNYNAIYNFTIPKKMLTAAKVLKQKNILAQKKADAALKEKI